MPSFIDFARNQYTHLPIPEPPANIKDATYIVTGANTGLGYECAKHLFHMGAKRIILAVRTPSKGEAALATIRSETGRKDVGEVWELDLTSLDSVEAFAQRVNKLDRLDAIIENAGVVMTKFQLVEGIETSVLVNVVSTMLLAFRVLPKLQESFTSSLRFVLYLTLALSLTLRDVPAWVTNETGKRTQKRVWDDLLKRLESLGHGVDIEALTTES
ncbi:Short-chain dehydrogenase/reductase SDR [Penicillium occitanis (nom. inval.)]|nr:Short-chain dehydrogenase/reductase SDR [Penicillium occitanis (nom. inval.)]PCG99675.1 hypothetical protein PENOC_056910 [Penicillium occitanis (nom. inval.)]